MAMNEKEQTVLVGPSLSGCVSLIGDGGVANIFSVCFISMCALGDYCAVLALLANPP